MAFVLNFIFALLLDKLPNRHHDSGMYRLMIIIESHRLSAIAKRETRLCGKFLIALENPSSKIFFRFIDGRKKQFANLLDFIREYIRFRACPAFVLFHHFIRNHHRKSSQFVHQHLLYNNDMSDVPNQVVAESWRDEIQLFWGIIQKLLNKSARRARNFKSVCRNFHKYKATR